MREKKTFLDKFNDIITKIGTIILMNLLFLVSCIGVVTIGQAWCGLLSALRFHIRGENWFDGFKFGFKNRFWRGTIAWCAVLALCVMSLFDLMAHINGSADMAAIIASGVMFALVAMLSVSLLVLNVYIPTSVSNWLKNAVNMIFKGHIWLLLSAAIMWLPAVMAVFWPTLFTLTVMIFFAAYYALAALLMTLLLKDALLEFLVEARTEGTLTAEEGRLANAEEEQYDEEEEEEA